MTIATRPFDPAEYLTTEEAVAAFLKDALESGDPREIRDAHAVATRATSRIEEGRGAFDRR